MEYTILKEDLEWLRSYEIIGDPENGCILPPGEEKRLLAESTVMKSLAAFMRCSEKEIEEVLKMRHTQYRKSKEWPLYYHWYRVFTTQKGKKERKDMAPCYDLVNIQDSLARLLLMIPISPIVTSGNSIVPGDPIENAKLHQDSDYVVKVDIKNAYPSVTTHRVFKNLQWSLGKHWWIIAPLLSTSKEKELFLRAVTHLLVHNNRLPHGASTSPSVFDIVTSRVDAKIIKTIDNMPIYKPVITRYRDDIVVSFQSYGKKILEMVNDIETIRVDPEWNKVYFHVARIKNLQHKRHFQSTPYHDTMKRMKKQVNDTDNDLEKAKIKETKQKIHEYIDWLIWDTLWMVKKTIGNVTMIDVIGNEKEIIKSELLHLLEKINDYYNRYKETFQLDDKYINIEKWNQIRKYLEFWDIEYPDMTIGDVKEGLIKTLSNEWYSVNSKKTRMQQPWSEYPIEITWIAKTSDNRLLLPKKKREEYSKTFNDLLRLSYYSIGDHAFYNKKFFDGNKSFYDIRSWKFNEVRTRILDHLYGVKNFIERVEWATTKQKEKQTWKRSKLLHICEECIKRWKESITGEDLALTTDQIYGASHHQKDIDFIMKIFLEQSPYSKEDIMKLFESWWDIMWPINERISKTRYWRDAKGGIKYWLLDKNANMISPWIQQNWIEWENINKIEENNEWDDS